MAIIFNGREVKLGRPNFVVDPREPKIDKFFNRKTGLFEARHDVSPVDWTHGKKKFGMMNNDTWGCCTASGCGHAAQIWTMNAYGWEFTAPDPAVLQFYFNSTGAGPGHDNDPGGDEPTVLAYFQKNGLAKHHVIGYGTARNIHNHNENTRLIKDFGGLYIGFQVPQGIPEDPGSVWDLPAGLPIEGGHCVFIAGRLANGNYIVITWGEIVYMTPAFMDAYNQEIHVILAESWFKAGRCPSGFDVEALEAEMKAM